MEYIAKPFGWLLMTLYNFVGNYGVAVFLFALAVVVISSIVATADTSTVVVEGEVVIVGRGLQGGVVVHLGLHALRQLLYGKFHKLCPQQLLLGDALLQSLLLPLFLYLGL